jgi:hypothetical protein
LANAEKEFCFRYLRELCIAISARAGLYRNEEQLKVVQGILEVILFIGRLPIRPDDSPEWKQNRLLL